MHIHATDPSVAMQTLQRIVRIVFVLCLVPVSEQLASIAEDWATGKKLQKFERSSHHESRCRKRETRRPETVATISLDFKCANRKSEIDSRAGMAQHRRHRSSVGTPCADPRNSKSMSLTARGYHSAGILRQHDTHGVLPIPAFFSQKMIFTSQLSPNEKIENSALIAVIVIRVILLS